MVIALVLISFVAMIVGGLVLNRVLSHRGAETAVLLPGEVETVEGFRLHAGLDYHPRHLWVGKVGKNVVRIGLDDFVRRIVGPPDRVRLPGVGRELMEGLSVIELTRAGKTVRLPAPVAGTGGAERVSGSRAR